MIFKIELTEVGVGYRGVDSSVNSGHRGSSVSDGLGGDRGGVAWRDFNKIIFLPDGGSHLYF